MEKIKTLGDKCIEQYPNRIPVIITYDNNIIFLNNKNKESQSRQSQMLVHDNTTIGYLCMIIGRNAKINAIENIRAVINNTILQSDTPILELFSKYKNSFDGCLHITVKY